MLVVLEFDWAEIVCGFELSVSSVIFQRFYNVKKVMTGKQITLYTI